MAVMDKPPDGLRIPNVLLAAALSLMIAIGGWFATSVTAQLNTISAQLADIRERSAAMEAGMRSVEFRLARLESAQDRTNSGRLP